MLKFVELTHLLRSGVAIEGAKGMRGRNTFHRLTAPIVIVQFILLGLSGCTAVKLKNSVAQQTQTLTNLQYTQVLNNLAMFHQNLYALPSQVTLHDGSSQIGDSGSAAVLFDIDGGLTTHPSLSASRTIVQQWGMNPVTDDTALQLLQLAYQRAAGFRVDLSQSTGNPNEPWSRDTNKFANTLAHALKDQISPQDPDLRYLMLEKKQDAKREMEESIWNRFNQRIDDIDSGSTVEDAEKYAKLVREQNQLLRKQNDTVRRQNETIRNRLDAKRLRQQRLQSRIEGITRNPKLKPEEKTRELENVIREFDDEPRSFAAEYDLLNVSTNDEFLVSPYDDLNNDFDIAMVKQQDGKSELASPTVKEIRRLIKGIQKDLKEIDSGWYGFGTRKEVPKDACYVGCCEDCYVWVCPDGLQKLSDITLTILSFSTLIEERQIIAGPGSGPRYSPALGQQPRFFIP